MLAAVLDCSVSPNPAPAPGANVVSALSPSQNDAESSTGFLTLLQKSSAQPATTAQGAQHGLLETRQAGASKKKSDSQAFQSMLPLLQLAESLSSAIAIVPNETTCVTAGKGTAREVEGFASTATEGRRDTETSALTEFLPKSIFAATLADNLSPVAFVQTFSESQNSDGTPPFGQQFSDPSEKDSGQLLVIAGSDPLTTDSKDGICDSLATLTLTTGSTDLPEPKITGNVSDPEQPAVCLPGQFSQGADHTSPNVQQLTENRSLRISNKVLQSPERSISGAGLGSGKEKPQGEHKSQPVPERTNDIVSPTEPRIGNPDRAPTNSTFSTIADQTTTGGASGFPVPTPSQAQATSGTSSGKDNGQGPTAPSFSQSAQQATAGEAKLPSQTQSGSDEANNSKSQKNASEQGSGTALATNLPAGEHAGTQAPLHDAEHVEDSHSNSPETEYSRSEPLYQARLINGPGTSEMHIGMRTPEFGNVELHTVVRGSQLGVSVGSEKGNLHELLAPELPSLQKTFQQHEFGLNSIRFLEHSSGAASGFTGGAGSEAHSFVAKDNSQEKARERIAVPQTVSTTEEITEIENQLNVQA